jgi:hypothetical protein
MVGLAVETLLAMPVALAFIGYQTATGTGHFSANLWLMLLLIGAGVVTSFPLLWFNNAAKRLRLSTLGLLPIHCPQFAIDAGNFPLSRIIFSYPCRDFWINLVGSSHLLDYFICQEESVV